MCKEQYDLLVKEFGWPEALKLEVYANDNVQIVIHPPSTPLTIFWKWGEGEWSPTTYFPCGCQVDEQLMPCGDHFEKFTEGGDF